MESVWPFLELESMASINLNIAEALFPTMKPNGSEDFMEKMPAFWWHGWGRGESCNNHLIRVLHTFFSCRRSMESSVWPCFCCFLITKCTTGLFSCDWDECYFEKEVSNMDDRGNTSLDLLSENNPEVNASWQKNLLMLSKWPALKCRCVTVKSLPRT